MSTARVLIFCPTYHVDGKIAVDDRTVASIEAQRKSFEGEIDVKYSTINPYPVPGKTGIARKEMLENVLIQYRAGRSMALEGGYDALFTVEHDMVIPDNALQMLWAENKPVIYGVYMMRHGPPRVSAWRAIKGPGVGMALDIFPDELRKARREVVAKTSGVGLGCTLIRREILEKFEFHRSNSGGHPSPDVPFATDVNTAGIQQYSHFGVICGHILPTGEILWPEWATDKEGVHASVKSKYVAIQSFNGQVGNNVMHFNAGDEYELSELDACEYVRAGFLMGKAITRKEIKPPAEEKTKARVTKKVKKPEKSILEMEL